MGQLKILRPVKRKKRPPLGPLERGKRGGKVSGKAMQDEVEAKAKTLGLETTTILDEDYDHSKVCDLFLLP
jgi:hypothetical protein